MWLILIFLGVSALIFVGLYMGWTAIGKGIIDGIQGRYFIPVALLPLICLIKKDKYIEFKYCDALVLTFICVINIYALNTIIHYYLI